MADLPTLTRRRSSGNGHYPPERASRALTAAATGIKLGDRQSVAQVRRREAWQAECWDAYDAVGEVKYGTGFLGNAMARLGLYVGVKPDDDDADPIPVTDAPPESGEAGPEVLDPSTYATVRDTLRRLAGGPGGHGEILRELTINLGVAGECYLYGRDEPTGAPTPPGGSAPAREVWDVRSIDEVSADAEGNVRIVDTDQARATDGRRLTGAEDENAYLIRVWQRHPRWSAKPDSMLRGVLGSVEELLLMEQAARSSARSRLPAGILLVPSELSFGAADGARNDDADEDPFLADLMDAMTTPIQDEGDASAQVPLVIRGAAEYLEKVRRVDLFRQLDEKVLARQDAALKRIAQGLNLPVEVITGIADVNHWNAWQIEESTFKAHVEPLAIMVVNALTEAFLLPFLEAAGVRDADRFVVWYDPDRLIARPNLADAANQAFDRGTISDDAYRRARGFDDTDAPDQPDLDPAVETALGLVRAAPSLVADPGLPALIEQVRAALGTDDGPAPVLDDPDDAAPDDGPVDPQADPVPDQPDGPADDVVVGATAVVAAGRIPEDLGRRLRDIDRDLRNRIEAAADSQMRRALEKVGAALRSKAKRDRAASDAIEGVDNDRVAATLGPSIVESLGTDVTDRIEAAFDPLADRFLRWCATAADATLDAMPALSGEDREVEARRLADHAEDAWRWFRQALIDDAKERIYDPEPRLPDNGEGDDVTLVPFDLVREAVARAGGLTEAQTVTAASDPILDAATSTAMGIATGLVAKSLLDRGGVATEAYEWDYGPYRRSQGFQPHVELDGVVFESFTDDALINPGDWPPEPYLSPGDHQGCRCDVTPVLIDARGEVGPEVPMTDPVDDEAMDVGLLTPDVDAPKASLRRHPAGGYTHVDDAGEGFYVRQLPTQEGRPGPWRIEEQFLDPDSGALMATRLGEARTLDDVRKVIGGLMAGRAPGRTGEGVRDFLTGG